MNKYKNKSLFFLMIILIATLFLAIGYALTNNQLNISGTAVAKQKPMDIDVYFSNYTTSGNGTITASINGSNNKQANFSITGLVGYGDTAVINYTIINNGTIDANLNITASTITNTEYFEITSNINNLNNTRINAGETKTLTIKVKVKKVLVSSNNTTVSASANLTIHASAVGI